MKNPITLTFAISVILFAGCNKSTPSADAPAKVADWGVIELSASNPKHLTLGGTEQIITGTPLADGNVALFIETKALRQTVNMIVPSNVQFSCYVGDKLVSFTVKIKTL